MITIEKARELRMLIEKASESLTDEEALNGIELFPKWKNPCAYQTGNRVRHADKLYKCLQDHTSESTWTPDTSPSLWVRVDDPSIEYPAWIQPLGSTDAYPIGAKVSHLEKHWISEIDANVYEPSVYGWQEV